MNINFSVSLSNGGAYDSLHMGTQEFLSGRLTFIGSLKASVTHTTDRGHHQRQLLHIAIITCCKVEVRNMPLLEPGKQANPRLSSLAQAINVDELNRPPMMPFRLLNIYVPILRPQDIDKRNPTL
jgi:hypothetical protein